VSNVKNMDDADQPESGTGPSEREPREPLDERKAAILRAVVNEHIETGQPVGSAHVSESAKLTVSSATVRNEMSALEREGYLTHPHTSAGRIPTDRGYRYFVDSLARLPDLTRSAEPLATHVGEFFDNAHGEIGRLLDHTTRLLSEMTDHTAVLMSPKADTSVVRSVQLVGLGPVTLPTGEPGEQVLVVTVLANGTIEKAFLHLGVTATAPRLAAATAHLTNTLVNRSVHNLPATFPATGDGIVDDLVSVAMQSIGASPEPVSSALLVGGAARVADSFEALQTVRSILSVLEEQYLVVTLLRETAKTGARVSIGGEHAIDTAYLALASCSLVVAPYRIDGRVAGSVGVLGPTRMNYPQVIAAVEAVSSGLSDHLSD
jgi:heat-inducible transcriptional repressor